MNRIIGVKEIDEYAQKYNMPVGEDTPLTMGWCFDMVDKAYEQGKADAIDECIKEIDKMFVYTDSRGNDRYASYSQINRNSIHSMLEQLKEKKND